MKRILLSALFALVIFSLAKSQTANTPREVKDAFQANYPGVTDASWVIDTDGNFEAAFEWEGRDYRSVYSRDGNWMESSFTLEDSEIPAAVSDGFTASEYRYWNIDHVSQVEIPGEGTIYRYDIYYEDYTDVLEFSEDGTRIQ